ncbi:MAG: hypothetical protein J0L58_09415 [Burkholderiales bacterium]|nr:hypothetical protein [Burkholderiales bacterium]
MGRERARRGKDEGRDGESFVAMPWPVLDCAAYQSLSHPARSLLWEIARQFVRDNNGQLLASRAYLAKRGWKSADVINRAKHELLEAELIFETVKGHRPNKAGWYAVTWRRLDPHPRFDPGVSEAFVRGAYRLKKNASLNPPGGTEGKPIGPCGGTRTVRPVPSGGPIRTAFDPLPVPPGGHHLEKPSAVPVSVATAVEVAQFTDAQLAWRNRNEKREERRRIASEVRHGPH